MPDDIVTYNLNRLCCLPQRTLVVSSIAITLALAAAAQTKAPLPKYDVQTETKIKGRVESLKQVPKKTKSTPAELLLKTDTDTVDVYLCPQGFLDEMGVSFTTGDEIQITGSKVKNGGTNLFLAREVVKGNDTVVLRDDTGHPVWNWQKRN